QPEKLLKGLVHVTRGTDLICKDLSQKLETSNVIQNKYSPDLVGVREKTTPNSVSPVELRSAGLPADRWPEGTRRQHVSGRRRRWQVRAGTQGGPAEAGEVQEAGAQWTLRWGGRRTAPASECPQRGCAPKDVETRLGMGKGGHCRTRGNRRDSGGVQLTHHVQHHPEVDMGRSYQNKSYEEDCQFHTRWLNHTGRHYAPSSEVTYMLKVQMCLARANHANVSSCISPCT
ncbi:Hypothetical predicted protein, partial [Pelobates cultripes]